MLKNINLLSFKKNKKVFINIDDEFLTINLKNIFLECFSDDSEPYLNYKTQDELLQSCMSSAELILKVGQKRLYQSFRQKNQLYQGYSLQFLVRKTVLF